MNFLTKFLYTVFCFDSKLELYDAAIDTTFSLVNQKSANTLGVRVAGDYTCFHLPWYKDFKNELQPGEYEAYAKNSIASCWYKRMKKYLFFNLSFK